MRLGTGTGSVGAALDSSSEDSGAGVGSGTKLGRRGDIKLAKMDESRLVMRIAAATASASSSLDSRSYFNSSSGGGVLGGSEAIAGLGVASAIDAKATAGPGVASARAGLGSAETGLDTVGVEAIGNGVVGKLGARVLEKPGVAGVGAKLCVLLPNDGGRLNLNGVGPVVGARLCLPAGVGTC